MSSKGRKLNGAFLKAYRANALTIQGGFCKYCFCPLTKATATADHRVPRYAGGTDKQGNIAACCYACNNAKGHMSETAFIRAIKSDRRLPIPLMLVRFSRRLWRRTHLASKRIRLSSGLEFHGPKAA